MRADCGTLSCGVPWDWPPPATHAPSAGDPDERVEKSNGHPTRGVGRSMVTRAAVGRDTLRGRLYRARTRGPYRPGA